MTIFLTLVWKGHVPRLTRTTLPEKSVELKGLQASSWTSNEVDTGTSGRRIGLETFHLSPVSSTTCSASGIVPMVYAVKPTSPTLSIEAADVCPDPVAGPSALNAPSSPELPALTTTGVPFCLRVRPHQNTFELLLADSRNATGDD